MDTVDQFRINVLFCERGTKLRLFIQQLQCIGDTKDKIVHPDYSRQAAAAYAHAQLHLIEGGAHGFGRKHDAEAIAYLKAFSSDKFD